MSRSASGPGTGAPLARLGVLRFADVPGEHPGGAMRAMSLTSAVLTSRGHVIEHRFSEDMWTPGSPRWRRILVPLMILRHVMRLKARGEAPDVVEVHEPLGAPYAIARALAGSRLPPMVAFSHGLEERAWRAQRARWRLRGERGSLLSRVVVPSTLVAQAKIALRLADAVVVLSSEDRDHLLQKRLMRSARVHRIDNGVEEDLLALGDRRPGGDRSQPLLLFVGSWIDRKGTPELASAFARLWRDHPRVRLAVAGAGIDPAEVLAAFPEPVRARVQVHRSVTRTELRELLGRADVFVLPSWFEGMPLSLLEAAAAGLAIVASDTCGIRDVLRPPDPERDGGRLVAPHDSLALYAALDELVRDPALRAQLGERAHARARAFAWTASAEALERIYLTTAVAR